MDWDGPKIDALLEKGCTLGELLQYDEVISECKDGNPAVLNFLTQPHTLMELANLLCLQPPAIDPGPEKTESIRRQAFRASELLATEAEPLISAICNDRKCLSTLFSVLDLPPDRLTPACVVYFSKAITVLCNKQGQLLTQFVLDTGQFNRLLVHIGLFSIAELVVRIAWATEDPSVESGLDSACLHDQALVAKLIARLDPCFPPAVHMNAASILGNLYNATQPAVAYCLNDVLQPSVLNLLFTFMFSGSESSFLQSLTVLATVLHAEAEREQRANCVLLKYLNRALPRLTQHLGLVDGKFVTTQYGRLQPLGFSRLKIVQVLHGAVRLQGLYEQEEYANNLWELNTLEWVLELFFRYELHNLLHAVVEKILGTIFDLPVGPVRTHLLHALFTKARLLPRLLATFQANTEAAAFRAPRLGHMGYIIRIALLVVDFGVDAIRALGVCSEDLDAWGTLITTTLADELQVQREKLGARPDDESDEEPLRASPVPHPLHSEDEEATWHKEATRIWPDSPRQETSPRHLRDQTTTFHLEMPPSATTQK